MPAENAGEMVEVAGEGEGEDEPDRRNVNRTGVQALDELEARDPRCQFEP